MNPAKLGLAALAALSIALVASHSGADTYPNKPIKLILPYTPGSPNDVLARIAGPQLSSRLGQPVIIDNRAGGGTSIGTKAVMTAEPDGYTLLFTNGPTHVIASLNKNFPYDPIKDFVPVAMLGSTSLALVISPAVPAVSLQEFIRYAKANPGKLNFGFGQGTLPQLVGEMFMREAGIDVASIPYRGGPQAATDLLGGRIQMYFGPPSSVAALIRDGKVRALAYTGASRSADLPEVPTMPESGLPNVTSITRYGILGPAGLPADIVSRLNSEVNESLNSPELKANMAKVGFELKGGSPQEFSAFIADDMKKWIPIAKTTGFSMD